MNQLIIKQEDIYKVDDIEYFKFRFFNGFAVMRDVYIDLSKNKRYVLETIAKECALDYRGLSKKNLIKLIENSSCLVFGD